MLIDMHCHLDLYSDPFEVAKECENRNLFVLSVTTIPRAWEGTLRLSAGSDRIQTALGFHPQLAHQRYQELELFDAILPAAKYVGEIGLDGGSEYKQHWEVQLKVFRHVLESLRRDGGRIMSIHTRHSAVAVLDELKGTEGIPILHWFTGSRTELKRAIDMGCWFSVGPTQLKTKSGKELLSMVPRDKILTETDGPFTKQAGKALMPWDVGTVFKELSSAWGCPEQEAQERIVINFKHLIKQNVTSK